MANVRDPQFWENKKREKVNKDLFARENTQRSLDKYGSNIQDRVSEEPGNNTGADFDRSIDPYKKDQLNEIVSDSILDTIWRNIFYVSTLNGPAVQTTSAAEKFDLGTREGDTSTGKYLSVKNESRFRCHFYFNGTDSLDSTTYIGTHGTATTGSPGGAILADTIEFVGLKIKDGALSIVSKDLAGITEQPLVQTLVDDTTFKLEIVINARENAIFFLNDKYVGAIATNVPYNTAAVTYLPLLVSITRGGATNRKVTIESYEFIQKR